MKLWMSPFSGRGNCQGRGLVLTPSTPMIHRPLRSIALVATTAAALVVAAASLGARQQPAAETDLDALMAKALERRAINQKTLNDYVLDETETFEVAGPGQVRLYRARREYMWYVREGVHVRSPLRYDGVTIAEDERRRYEERWFERHKGRLKRRAERRAKVEQEAQDTRGRPMPPLTEPQFVSEAYFLEFKFEPGNYYLAGRERLEGHDVLRIEYYPTRLFDSGPEGGGIKGRRDEPKDEQIARKMNKTSLVTLWVDPAEYQIVKFTFDNVWLDFLPGAWLVRVDDLKASMVMGQPFAGVWLPRAITIHAGMTLANGSYAATYSREFSDYRQADVKSTIRIPKP